MTFERLEPNDEVVLRYARMFFTVNPPGGGTYLQIKQVAESVDLGESEVREAAESLLEQGLAKDPMSVPEIGLLGFCDLTSSGRRMADDIGPQMTI